MSTYKGRDQKGHDAWIRDNADYFTVFLFRGRQRYETKTLDEAKEIAAKALVGHERNTQPAMIYAVKEIHSAMVGSYHPITGFKPIKS